MAGRFTIPQGALYPAIWAILKDGVGNPVNLTGASVRFRLADLRYKTVVDGPAQIPSPVSGMVTYQWTDGDTDVYGDFLGEWIVTFADDTVQKYPKDEFNKVVIRRSLAPIPE